MLLECSTMALFEKYTGDFPMYLLIEYHVGKSCLRVVDRKKGREFSAWLDNSYRLSMLADGLLFLADLVD